MTLNTKILGIIHFEIFGIIGSVRIVTGDTVNRHAGPRVVSAGTDRVREFSLGFMAATADLIPISVQHGQVIRTMYLMAVRAGTGQRMTVGLIDIIRHRVSVAVAANVLFPAAQQLFIVGGMGRMAIGAAVISSRA